ncbi:hypothetical protein FRC98_12220 [Lujinxingia vulgaris]|uniref:Kazal-like domain-containing protein n=1 Tax=Lujinxingia vulgaris TaxID=2600176 RepID=A0A5C6X4D3_9DELT|nr:Kazal-type serine protease inhibitor domain-containing protein [Lujinxingia vulgaris]TXD36596.1 hypothetical protein FRC98_12220 [Lujinxingia vulgaris]
MMTIKDHAGVYLAIFALLLALAAGCAHQNSSEPTGSSEQASSPAPEASEPKTPPADCICPMHYMPVCGEDGATYGNACQAACVDVSVAHEGECEAMSEEEAGEEESAPVCACPRHLAPVCGEDGETYANPCLAKCAEVGVAYEGECAAASDEEAGEEESAPVCACPRHLAPVCGEDGETYANPCLAKCAEVGVAHEGACGEEQPGQED